MSKEMSIILLGVAVVIIPYLGIPSAGRTLLLVAAGITLIVIGFLLRSREVMHTGTSSPHRPFVEHMPSQVHDAVSATNDFSQHDHKEGITSLN